MNKQGNGKNNLEMFSEFNVNNFKRWIKNQEEDDDVEQELLGKKVESKINFKKLVSRINILDPEEGEEELLAKEFRQEGGIVSDIDGNNFLIEVSSGSFTIHKMYVKKV
jgi:hypothetical protein